MWKFKFILSMKKCLITSLTLGITSFLLAQNFPDCITKMLLLIFKQLNIVALILIALYTFSFPSHTKSCSLWRKWVYMCHHQAAYPMPFAIYTYIYLLMPYTLSFAIANSFRKTIVVFLALCCIPTSLHYAKSLVLFLRMQSIL